MSDYTGIWVYAGFSLILFGVALVWHKYRETIKKRFHLVNYHSKSDHNKTAPTA